MKRRTRVDTQLVNTEVLSEIIQYLNNKYSLDNYDIEISRENLVGMWIITIYKK